MKILQIMASCSRESGVAHVVMNYYRHIYEDIVFDFLLYWDVEQSFKEEIERLGGSVFIMGKPGLQTVVPYLQQVDRFFAEHAREYDAVHLHEVYLSGIIFPIARKHGMRVLISHSHTTQFSDKKLNALRNSLLFYPARFLSTNYFGCSKAAGVLAFGEKKVNSDAFYLQKNAIDTGKFLYSEEDRIRVREELGVENNLVIGHVGRFAPQKNHMFLLEVFSKVKEKAPNAKLLLVGNGPDFYNVQKRAEELDISDSVIQTGVRKDVGALLSAMDIFVLPSIFEGLAVSLVEVQCSGLPCVVSASVTEEAKILPNYHILSLAEAPEVWADTILSCDRTRNLDAKVYITKAGYELSSAAKELLEKYRLLCDMN